MDINWNIIGVVVVLAVVLVVLTTRRNQKEKKKFTEKLNNDFKKTEKSDVDADDSANEK